MPTLSEIQNAVLAQKNGAQDATRRRYLKALGRYTGRDTIIYATAFTVPKLGVPQGVFAVDVGDMPGFMSAMHGLRGDNLDLILHSPGGSLEAADQIVQYLRAKYKHIRAIVPQNAMSAATMIACACDEIVMGKHSALGPIDPQMSMQGRYVPAQAILDEFERAKNEVAADPRTAPLWLTKIQAYPPGFLQQCSTTISLSRDKAGEWLDAYMFRDSTATPKPGVEIANWLGEANAHKTHGRPISIETARSKGLKVTALEDDQRLQEKVLSVFHSIMVTFQVTNCAKMIENNDGKGWYMNVEVKQAP